MSTTEKFRYFCYPPSHPTTLGDVWIGQTKPSIEALLEIIRLNEISSCRSTVKATTESETDQ